MSFLFFLQRLLLLTFFLAIVAYCTNVNSDSEPRANAPQYFFKRNAQGAFEMEMFTSCFERNACPAKANFLGYGRHFVDRNHVNTRPLRTMDEQIMSILQVEPPNLSFEERSRFVPAVKTFLLLNSHDTYSISVLSAFSDSPSFLFKLKSEHNVTILPRGNATVSVLFIPNAIGSIRGNLCLSLLVDHTTNSRQLAKMCYELQGKTSMNKFDIDTTRHYLVAGSTVEEHLSVTNIRPHLMKVKEFYVVNDLGSGGANNNSSLLSVDTSCHTSLTTTSTTNTTSVSAYTTTDNNNNYLRISCNDSRNNKLLLEIPSLQKKPCFYVQFTGRKLGEYTVYLHVLMEFAERQGDMAELFFIIPLEFVVIPFQPHEIDFGTLTSSSEQRYVHLRNEGPYSVLLQDITTLDDAPLIRFIDFAKGTLLPSNSSFTSIATVTFRSNSENHYGEYKGQMLVKTTMKETEQQNEESPTTTVVVPFRVRIFQGKLLFPNVTSFHVFHSNYKIPTERVLEITNEFQVPVQFQSALIHDTNFKIKDFQVNLVLKQQQTSRILTLELKLNQSLQSLLRSGGDVLLQTVLEIQTNITKILVPVHIFHGKAIYAPLNTRDMKSNINDKDSASCDSLILHKAITEFEQKDDEALERLIRFGVIPMPDGHLRHEFALYNSNPVPIALRSVEIIPEPTRSGVLSLSLVKMCTKKGEILPSEQLQFGQGSIVLQPGDKAILKLDAKSTNTKDKYEGVLHFETNFNRSVNISVSYWQLQGDIFFSYENETPMVDFGEVFPGKILRYPIFVTNTYEKGTKIIFQDTTDPRFSVVLKKKSIPSPSDHMEIGYVEFDPTKKDDYLEIVEKQKRSKRGATFIKKEMSSKKRKKRENFSGLSEITKTEMHDNQRQIALFNKLKEKSITAQIILRTSNFLINYTLSAKAQLIQPRISTSSLITFPVTQIGQLSKHFVTIANPSNLYISVKLTIRHPIESEHTTATATNTEFYLDPDGTHVAVIPPNKDVQLGPIIFSPTSHSSEHNNSPVLFLRNNLTVLETIQLKGVGGRGKLSFENKKGDLLKELRFEVKESAIGSWKHGLNKPQFVIKSRKGVRGLSFKKKFMLVNSGNLPIHVQQISINGYGCSAFNVKLYTCGQFTLQPGQRIPFKMSYRPDFSVAVMNLTITFQTLHSPVEQYPISFTIPRSIMSTLFFMLHAAQAPNQSIFWTILGFSTPTNYVRVTGTVLVLLIAAYLIYFSWSEETKIFKKKNEDTELPVIMKQEESNIIGIAPSTSNTATVTPDQQPPVLGMGPITTIASEPSNPQPEPSDAIVSEEVTEVKIPPLECDRQLSETTSPTSSATSSPVVTPRDHSNNTTIVATSNKPQEQRQSPPAKQQQQQQLKPVKQEQKKQEKSKWQKKKPKQKHTPITNTVDVMEVKEVTPQQPSQPIIATFSHPTMILSRRKLSQESKQNTAKRDDRQQLQTMEPEIAFPVLLEKQQNSSSGSNNSSRSSSPMFCTRNSPTLSPTLPHQMQQAKRKNEKTQSNKNVNKRKKSNTGDNLRISADITSSTSPLLIEERVQPASTPIIDENLLETYKISTIHDNKHNGCNSYSYRHTTSTQYAVQQLLSPTVVPLLPEEENFDMIPINLVNDNENSRSFFSSNHTALVTEASTPKPYRPSDHALYHDTAELKPIVLEKLTRRREVARTPLIIPQMIVPSQLPHSVLQHQVSNIMIPPSGQRNMSHNTSSNTTGFFFSAPTAATMQSPPTALVTRENRSLYQHSNAFAPPRTSDGKFRLFTPVPEEEQEEIMAAQQQQYDHSQHHVPSYMSANSQFNMGQQPPQIRFPQQAMQMYPSQQQHLNVRTSYGQQGNSFFTSSPSHFAVPKQEPVHNLPQLNISQHEEEDGDDPLEDINRLSQ